MVALRGRCEMNWSGDPFVAKVVAQSDTDGVDRESQVLLSNGDELPAGYRAYLVRQAERAAEDGAPVVELSESLGHLEDGDIVRINPRMKEVAVLYRRRSKSNVIFTTERCNSDCVMCSQPPRVIDDDYLVDVFLEAIPLMDRATTEMGISGGEPTLLGPRLFELVSACRDHLPETALHMLSNGRLFNYLALAQRLAAVRHPDLMVGIPLYADIASHHDFIVQATGAFDQTVRGIVNLKRCGVAVEIRVVLHRYSVARLPELCQFIARNLPVVDHVALMGLEPIGYVKMNHDALWIDPLDYQKQLQDGVRTLRRSGLAVSIYNHQLCVLDRQLWPFACMSISDWKNEYDAACVGCSQQTACGGFFGHSTACRSRGIKAIHYEEVIRSV